MDDLIEVHKKIEDIKKELKELDLMKRRLDNVEREQKKSNSRFKQFLRDVRNLNGKVRDNEINIGRIGSKR